MPDRPDAVIIPLEDIVRKTFDCVEMKHRAAEKVQARLAGMTLDEQVGYWERRGRKLRKRKVASLARRKTS
jgi:hypothetical protein